MRLTRLLIFPLILVIVLFSISPSRLDRNEPVIERTKFLMGSLVQIKVSLDAGEDKKHAEEAIGKAFEEIGRIESVFSIYRNESEISKINRLKKGEALKVDDEVFAVIEKSVEYNKKTNGAFDITVKPLIDLWQRCKVLDRLPKEDELKDALAKAGSQYIVLDKAKKTISFAKGGMAIDLGGVGQGYATDRAIKVLKENGINNAIVNSSGDMYCLGRKSKKDLWNVGIQHPRKKGELILDIELENKAINTSGDYEKFFILEGRRFSHIIDPGTGYAVGDDVVSATVIALDSTTADILATALCILGREGLKVIGSMKGADAVIIFKEGDRLKVEMSEGLKARYAIAEETRL